MTDLDALKSRVDRAVHNLDAAREARDSQGAALVEMWRQIRDRFTEQEDEIAEYRARLASLEDQHAELTRQVEALLEVVDRSIGRAGDETVPKIAGVAQALLDGEDLVELDDVPELPAAPTDARPPRERAESKVRGLVGRVEEAHLAIPAAPDPDRHPDDAARDEIDDLRAELEQLHHRLGGQRG